MTKQSEIAGDRDSAGEAGEGRDPRGDNYARWFLITLFLGFVVYGAIKYQQVTTALDVWEKQNASGDDARFLPPNR